MVLRGNRNNPNKRDTIRWRKHTVYNYKHTQPALSYRHNFFAADAFNSLGRRGCGSLLRGRIGRRDRGGSHLLPGGCSRRLGDSDFGCGCFSSSCSFIRSSYCRCTRDSGVCTGSDSRVSCCRHRWCWCGRSIHCRCVRRGWTGLLSDRHGGRQLRVHNIAHYEVCWAQDLQLGIHI
jgi:hypothetical protein